MSYRKRRGTRRSRSPEVERWTSAEERKAHFDRGTRLGGASPPAQKLTPARKGYTVANANIVQGIERDRFGHGLGQNVSMRTFSHSAVRAEAKFGSAHFVWLKIGSAKR